MNAVTMQGYTRISKAKARRLYDSGGTVYVQSCKYRPENAWQSAMGINKAERKARYLLEDDDSDLQFDSFVRNFENYNCDYERGYYAAFYVKG